MKIALKRFGVLLMCLALAFSLCACNGDRTGSESSAAGSAAGASSPPAETDHSEPVELSMVLVTDGMEYPGNAAMQEAFNKITQEKLNVTVNFKRVSFYDMATNLNLWLSSGEPCDLFEGVLNWSSFIQQGYMVDLTDYQELMPNAVEAAGGYMVNGYVDGKLYGIPSLKDMVNYSCYFFRKDMVEETGVDPAAVTTYEAMGDLMRAIKSNNPDITPLSGDAGNSVLYTSNIYSPDNTKLVMSDILAANTGIGLMEPTASSEVSCLYFTDYYEYVVNLAYDWNQEGLLKPSDMSSGPEQVLAGTIAGSGGQYKPGAEAEWTGNAGNEMVAVCYPESSDAARITSSTWNWSVGHNCENVERACELIDLLFTDQELNNLLAWGVESEDYVLTDDPNMIEYPEGMDTTNATYYNWAKFSLPNNYLQYVMEPNPSDLWEEMKAYNNAASPSKALGFTYVQNDDDINSKIVEITNIVTEYNPGLGSGELDASMLEEFRQKLTDAGVEDVIAHVQAQLDEYIAAQ